MVTQATVTLKATLLYPLSCPLPAFVPTGHLLHVPIFADGGSSGTSSQVCSSTRLRGWRSCSLTCFWELGLFPV